MRTGKKRQPTDQQIRAGVRVFSQFGFVPTVDRLAGGDPLKWRAVLNLSWAYAIAKLELDAVRGEYEENLFEIKKKEDITNK